MKSRREYTRSYRHTKVGREKHQAYDKRRNDKSREFARMARKRWEDVDKCLVLDHRVCDFELGKQLGRSLAAISRMRSRLMEAERGEG
jgi:hypothetical protein